MSATRWLSLVLLCGVVARAYVLVNDSPSAAHASVQAVAQQFIDRPGKPSIDAAVPFALPAGAGNCTGTLGITGAFRAVATSGSAVPGAMVFGLGQGPAPPNALGPASMRISWTLNSTTTGFAAAMAAGGNASSAFTFIASLRLTPLVPLPPGQVYWLTLHASLADSNGAANNRFFWRMLDAGYVSTGTGSALPSSIRDPSNILGRGWTTWTAASTVAEALFSAADAASALPRFAVRIEATSCTGDSGEQTPVVVTGPPPPIVTVPSPPVQAQVPSPPVTVKVPSPRVLVPSPPLPPPPAVTPSMVITDPEPTNAPSTLPDTEAPPDGTPVPADLSVSPSGNVSAIGNESLLFTTPGIIGIIVTSALVFSVLIIALVLLVRRWLNLRRIKRDILSMREFEQLNGNGAGNGVYAGGVIVLGTNGAPMRTASSLPEHANISLDTSSDLNGLDGGNGTGVSQKQTRGVPPLPLRDHNMPWIAATDHSGLSYEPVDTAGGNSGSNTPRSARLVAEDDDPDAIANLTLLPRKSKAGAGGLGASPRRLKKRRTGSASQPGSSDEDDANS